MQPSKPYNNKKVYDPGRLRHNISFLNEVSIADEFGGSQVNLVIRLTTFAGKEKLSQYKQYSLQQDKSQMDIDAYFVIRNRKEFYPEKYMVVQEDDKIYTIYGVVELDDPCTYLGLLCVLSK